MINHPKLMRICLERWFRAEGCCWDGSIDDDQAITEEESKWVKDIYDDVVARNGD